MEPQTARGASSAADGEVNCSMALKKMLALGVKLRSSKQQPAVRGRGDRKATRARRTERRAGSAVYV